MPDSFLQGGHHLLHRCVSLYGSAGSVGRTGTESFERKYYFFHRFMTEARRIHLMFISNRVTRKHCPFVSVRVKTKRRGRSLPILGDRRGTHLSSARLGLNLVVPNTFLDRFFFTASLPDELAIYHTGFGNWKKFFY